MPNTPLIAVVGARGGAGTSVVAAALAHVVRRMLGRGVLVDLDAGSAGSDVLLGIEDEPGARWPQLDEARGDVDGRGLVAALPRWGSVPVLATSRFSPDPPADDVVLDVVAALLGAGEAVVADLPRPGAWTPAVRALLADADDVLVVAPATLTGAGGAVAVVRALGETAPATARLVVRAVPGGGPHADDVADLTGLALAARFPHDRGLAAALDRGEGPRVGHGTRLGRSAAEVAEALGVGGAR